MYECKDKILLQPSHLYFFEHSEAENISRNESTGLLQWINLLEMVKKFFLKPQRIVSEKATGCAGYSWASHNLIEVSEFT